MTEVGARFVQALAAKDTAALQALFTDPTVFRGMTPGRFWEATTPAEVVHGVLYQWFDGADEIEGIEGLVVGDVVDRHRVDYRLRVRNPRGLHLVEQRAYYDLDTDGRVARMHVMCAGFRPVGDAVPPA